MFYATCKLKKGLFNLRKLGTKTYIFVKQDYHLLNVLKWDNRESLNDYRRFVFFEILFSVLSFQKAYYFYIQRSINIFKVYVLTSRWYFWWQDVRKVTAVVQPGNATLFALKIALL